MHKQDASCSGPSFLSILCRLSASRYFLQFARSTLPLSRAQIFADTPLNVRRRGGDGTPHAKFGISSNLSSTNIRLLVFRERLYPPHPPSPPPYHASFVLSTTFTTSSRRILAGLISTSDCYYLSPVVHLVERLFAREGNRVSAGGGGEGNPYPTETE